jgi:hypothetical protein
VAVNTADNLEGTIDFCVTQTYPAEARDGSGVLGSIIFEGISGGASEVRFEEIDLRTTDWPYTKPIPSVGQAGTVTIGSDRY